MQFLSDSWSESRAIATGSNDPSQDKLRVSMIQPQLAGVNEERRNLIDWIRRLQQPNLSRGAGNRGQLRLDGDVLLVFFVLFARREAYTDAGSGNIRSEWPSGSAATQCE